nr:MAG TPA: hypothetical protein [Caudoviricetes sp.]
MHPVSELVTPFPESVATLLAAVVNVLAVTTAPLPGVILLPVTASRGCVIFVMCSRRILPPVAGFVE